MYTFMSVNNGIFDDNGENVQFISSDGGDKRFGFLFPDGKHCLLTDFGSVKVSDVVTRNTHERIYKYCLETGEMEEMLTAWTGRGQTYVLLLISDDRFLVTHNRPNAQELVFCNFDGSVREPLLENPGGYSYGFSLSPDRKTIAFHNTSEDPRLCPPDCIYAINAVDVDGKNHRIVHSKPGHLMFGTSWTADSKYIVFQDCFARHDRAHRFSDICIATPDGKEVRYLTEGQRCCFATAFGFSKGYNRGGSNYPVPMDDRHIIYTYTSPDAYPEVEYHPELPDHEQDVYAPEKAKGGAVLVIHDIYTDQRTPITEFKEGKWDFRACVSPDKKKIFYTSATMGASSEIRVCNIDGSDDKFVTSGYENTWADHVGYKNYEVKKV